MTDRAPTGRGADGGLATTAGCALALGALAPMLAHLVWRPLGVHLGGLQPGVALAVSVAAPLLALPTALLIQRPHHQPAAVAGGACALALAVGWAVGGPPAALSLLWVAAAVLIAAPRVAAALPPCAPSRWRFGLWAASAALATVVSADLATYLADPFAAGHGVHWDPYLHRHLCFTAYMHASELLATGADNIYDLARIPPPGAGLPDSAAFMAPFTLDRYGYPPQFLLAPMALRAVVPDFFAQRALWTTGNALFFAYVLWRVMVWVGPRSGRALLAGAPALWLLGGIVYQSGNVQFTVFGVGALAMIAFDEGRDRRGGLYLAAVTLAKIAPGLLGVLLIMNRRWRATAWTVAWALALSAVSLAVMGWAPFADFLGYHLPKIASGEAYDFLDDTPRLIIENLAPFSVPFKLGLAGASLDPWTWGPRVAQGFTVLVFAITLWVARRPLDRRGHMAVWSVVLTLASLRSPMSPGYLLAGVILALGLAAAEWRRPAAWGVGGVLLVLMLGATPLVPVGFTLSRAAAGQVAMYGVIGWLLWRRWPRLDRDRPPHPLGGAYAAPPGPGQTR